MGKQATAIAIIMGKSKYKTASETLTPPVGETMAQMANTVKMLKILLPTTFPTAISLSPLMAATTEVANSGREVPAATMVRPIIQSLTPILRAISVALPTSHCDPKTKKPTPNNMKAIFLIHCPTDKGV